MTERIYHLTALEDWHQAKSSGKYKPKNFDNDGFIHCSYPYQLIEVANERFRGQADLVLLGIDRSKLRCEIIDENLVGGTDLFPHIYGPLPLEAVVEIMPFPCNVDGSFALPFEL